MGFLKIFQLFVVLAKLWKILKKWVLLSFGWIRKFSIDEV
jgi:hypothetical protein